MPRYFFQSWDGDRFVPDDEGLELEGIEDARALGARALGEMAKDSLPASSDDRVLGICLTDGSDKPVLELRLVFEILREG